MTSSQKRNITKTLGKVLFFALVIFVFFFSISLLSRSFSQLGKDVADSILNATSNPFIGLFIGLLMTAIIQSSSTSTSMIVAAVAAGTVSLTNAIPIVMGANIGTTITSTIISLGYITKKKEFKQAISAGVVHDFFNILITAILFPLEYYYGFLSSLAVDLTEIIFSGQSSIGNLSFFDFNLFDDSVTFLVDIIGSKLVLLLIAFVLLFSSIKILSNLIYADLVDRSIFDIEKVVFRTPLRSFAWGTLFTAAVQSSSSSTSLIVTLVATSKVPLPRAFQFIMGANIGTTLTAFMAAFAKSDAAMSIALVHLLFNFIGVLIFFPFPFITRIPLIMAEKFSNLTFKFRILGFVYILTSFFIIPFALISMNKEPAKRSYHKRMLQHDSSKESTPVSIL